MRLEYVRSEASQRAVATPKRVPASEEAVIAAIQQGDRDAFAGWVRLHDGWIRGVIFAVLGRHDLVDDVAQQVWSSAWSRLGELRDASRSRWWLYRLARNAALDAGRDITRQRSKARGWADHAGISSSVPNPDQGLIAEESHREVLDAIQSLPDLYREPFVLRHLQGWSYRQIAEAMGMPLDTVETRLVRAMRQLRDALKSKIR